MNDFFGSFFFLIELSPARATLILLHTPFLPHIECAVSVKCYVERQRSSVTELTE